MKQKKRSAANKRTRNTGRMGQTRGWIAMGTLAAYAAMGGTRAALAPAYWSIVNHLG